MLNSAAACHLYIKNNDPAAIASQLRCDQDACTRGQLPSLLALYLPPPDSKIADEVSLHLQRDKSVQIPRAVRRFQDGGIIQGIKAYIEMMSKVKNREPPNQGIPVSPGNTLDTIITQDIRTTIVVLQELMESRSVGEIAPDTPLKDVLASLV